MTKGVGQLDKTNQREHYTALQMSIYLKRVRTHSNICVDHYYNIHGMTHIHEMRNLVYQRLIIWRHTSRTRMETTWIGPSLNGTDLRNYVGYFQRLWFDFCITLPCEIRVRLTAILAMNATWLLAQEDATTWLHERKGLAQEWINRHPRQYGMNTKMELW